MPYITRGKCVYKKDTGKKVGCTSGSVKDYLSALHANVHEGLDGDDIQNKLESKYGEYLEQLWISETRTSIRLSAIIIKDEFKSSGIGTKIMNELVDYAEQNGKIIVLTPSSDYGGSKNRLIQFYKRFGFKHNKGVHKNYQFQDAMIRYPRRMSESMNYYARSLKSTIKSKLREHVELTVTDETPDVNTFSLRYNDRIVGTMGIAPVTNMDNTLELAFVGLKPEEEFHSMKIMSDLITSIWEEFKDTQRIIFTPMPESKTFWHKLGAIRLNDNFLMINRGH